ncbi:MAG: agmatinase [candidate division WOR-3 bacterium]|nr:MAG: agmatinase [candidate division WOR-3 bacterium]
MEFYFAESGYDDADIVIVGMPLDRTSSFIPGSRFGPDAARVGMSNIETYSPYQQRDVSGLKVHDSGNLEFTFETQEAPFNLISERTRETYAAGKKQLALGGEHTITPAIVRELARTYDDLCVLQFDAHCDLRDEYLGEKWCHAAAMSRVLDFVPRQRLFQAGIRSFSEGRDQEEVNVHAFDVLEPVDGISEIIGSRPTYLTLDVDVLDPGVFPDVQTPQPGGCTYRELTAALARLSGLNVVGCDLVEFAPRSCLAAAGSSAAAELVRELTLLLG